MNNDSPSKIVSLVLDSFDPDIPPKVILFDLENDPPEKLYPYIGMDDELNRVYLNKMRERQFKNKENNNTDTIG